jgi:hypothetical protein
MDPEEDEPAIVTTKGSSVANVGVSGMSESEE